MKRKMSQEHHLARPHRLRQGVLATHAALLALGQAVSIPAQAQTYVNYDGTRTSDEKAAVASWANHPEFKADWGLGAMNAQYAYARGLSGAGVKLGAVDSGYLPTHQEFASRDVIALRVKGTYLNDGEQLDGSQLTWRAGEAFDRQGAYIGSTDLAKKIGANDNHGNHVSGTIAAARNGAGMMGVSFGSQYYTTNSNGTDLSRYGSNMDYNYFKAAYGNLAAAGVRAINSSWGTPADADNYKTLPSFTQAYLRLNSAGKKTWLDAAADVSLQYGVLQVWANGNAGAANASTRAGLPYFRPEIEKYWIAATGLKQSGDQGFNQCGLAKYWCVAAPGFNILSANVAGDDQYKSSSGTSMSAPHVTGALGILMERYPYLGNEEIRTILLTTASHRGAGSADTPNESYGWGVPDLRKGMDGPAQLLGKFTANLPAGMSDTWKNSISEAALTQRRREEAAEIAAWATEKSALQSGIKAVPNARQATPDVIAGMAQARALLEEAIRSNVSGVYTADRFDAALAALRAAPQGPLLLDMYEAANPGWSDRYSKATDYTAFIAGRSDSDLAQAAVNTVRNATINQNKSIMDQIDVRQVRVNALAAKTDADYRGSLVKAGAGTLVLAGDNSYSGGTELREGTLGVGHNNALGIGGLAIANGATLLAAADNLSLGNAITLTGLGKIDTQAWMLTLTGELADGQAAGGLAKLGAGTLVLAGASTYSGPTLLLDGALRAGSASGFSSRSAFLLNTGTQLDLGGRDQAIGSLSGGGAVALGAATLTTGADNQHSVYTGRIQGTGGLTKTGAGTFTLGADNSAYRGRITVAGGGLRLRDDARLGASVLVRTGALLGGTGTLGATVIEAGAVHAPGNPVGTQKVTGDYVNRGTLRASGAPSAVSRVDVAGGVDITGATLELRLSPLDAAAWQPLNGPYTLIAKGSPGAVKGEFAAIRNPLLFLDAPVSTTGGDGNDVTLALKRNDRGMASLANTANQASTAAAIDALPQSHEVWRTVALSNSAADLNPALAQLSGDTHASVASALAGVAMAPASLNGLAALRHNLSAPMQPGAPTAAADNGAPPPASAQPRSGASPLWIQLGGEWSNLAGDGNAPNLTQRSTSLTIGGDAAVGGGWRMGGAFGYTDARLGAQARQASAKTDSYSATVYGGKAYALGAGWLRLMAGGAYSWHEVDSQRQVRYGSLDQRLTANYGGASTQLFTEVGYVLPLAEAASIEPFVGLAWSQLRMRAFSESGGSAALSSDGQRQRNISSLAGLRGNLLVPGSSIALRGLVGWRHVYGNARPSVALSFDQGAAFSVAGAPIARDAARIELGADLVKIRNMTAGLSYGGEFGGGNRQHAGSLDVRWRF